jgi:hypothetical protein
MTKDHIPKVYPTGGTMRRHLTEAETANLDPETLRIIAELRQENALLLELMTKADYWN